MMPQSLIFSKRKTQSWTGDNFCTNSFVVFLSSMIRSSQEALQAAATFINNNTNAVSTFLANLSGEARSSLLSALNK
jgi:hypothetical protein